MSVTRADLLTALQRRLADAGGQLWTADELKGYIQEGYDNLTKRTGCLFDTALLPDYAFSFSITGEWEKEYLRSGEYANGPAQFTCEFERNYIDNARGPANHTQNWEFNGGYVDITEVSPLVNLPGALQEVERATWNTRRITALRSSDIEDEDGRYELNKGEVVGYLQDKDGIDVLRKFRVPSAAYAPYSFDSSSDDGFGILRDTSGIVTHDTLSSEEFGDLVQLDGVNVFEDFGILGPIFPDTNVMRLEFRRRGEPLSDTNEFEIADRYTVYVRHYAQARALEREGPGQDLKLAKNFSDRYEAGIARMLERKKAMQYQRTYVMGGGDRTRKGPPLARLGWQYGPAVRRYGS